MLKNVWEKMYHLDKKKIQVKKLTMRGRDYKQQTKKSWTNVLGNNGMLSTKGSG